MKTNILAIYFKYTKMKKGGLGNISEDNVLVCKCDHVYLDLQNPPFRSCQRQRQENLWKSTIQLPQLYSDEQQKIFSQSGRGGMTAEVVL